MTYPAHSYEIKNHVIFLGILLVVALGFRLPGVPWGITEGDYLGPDEWQHVGIATNLIHSLDRSLVPAGRVTVQRNARGFGVQLGLVAILASRLGFRPSNFNMILMGRLISVMYGALLVIFLYIFCAFILRDPLAGCLSGLLLAGSDLHVTYSHYALPEVAHAFWFFVSVILLILYYTGRQNIWVKLGIGVGQGMCLAFKLDPVPSLTFGILLLLQLNRGWRRLVGDLVSVSFAAVCTLLLSWASLDIVWFAESLRWVRETNYDVIKSDKHLFYNPLLYLAAVVADTSLPAFYATVAGIWDTLKSKSPLCCQAGIVLMIAPSLLFLIYWLGDATFVRRASSLIPFCALFGGVFLARLWRRQMAAIAVPLVIGYTFALTALSQFAFLDDTRYQARRYLNNYKLPPQATVAYDRYARAAVPLFDHTVSILDPKIWESDVYKNIGLVVLHETYYGRYSKYFTTPLRIPQNCDEVYNCDPKVMKLVQDIIFDRSQFKLVKRFEVWHPFPERAVFKALFGTYETFLGDVLIYAMQES